MALRLIPAWQKVFIKAYSIRFMALAAVLTGLEVGLPFVVDFIPHGIFAIGSVLSTAGGFVARLVAQRDFLDE